MTFLSFFSEISIAFLCYTILRLGCVNITVKPEISHLRKQFTHTFPLTYFKSGCVKGSLVQLLTFLEHSVMKHHHRSRSHNRWATGGGDERGGFTLGPGDRRKVITAEPIRNTSVCRGYWWQLGCSTVKVSINQSVARS